MTPSTHSDESVRFISGPCGICCGAARYADGRWCESCGKTGTVHMMVTDDADREVVGERDRYRAAIEKHKAGNGTMAELDAELWASLDLPGGR